MNLFRQTRETKSTRSKELFQILLSSILVLTAGIMFIVMLVQYEFDWIFTTVALIVGVSNAVWAVQGIRKLKE